MHMVIILLYMGVVNLAEIGKFIIYVVKHIS